MRRPILTSLICALTALAAAGCTTHRPATASVPPVNPSAAVPGSPVPICAGATFTFGTVTSSDLITARSDAIFVTRPGPITSVLRPLREAVAKVDGTNVPATEAYAAFADIVGVPVADLGSRYEVTSGRGVAARTGAFVLFAGVKTVSATLRYTCEGVDYPGSVTSWTVARTGILQCGGLRPPDYLRTQVSPACETGDGPT